MSASRLTTVKETTLPPISGLFETRGSCRRSTLTRVENSGQSAAFQKRSVRPSSDKP